MKFFSLLRRPPENWRKGSGWLAAAAKLYELGKLSSGRAAELAGLSRISFLQALAQYGVAIFELTEEELRRDLEHA